jgi:hypothetical protein
LPPIPAFAEKENFLRPPDFPKEWGVHEPFARTAKTSSIAADISPYVVHSLVSRIDVNAVDSVILGRMTPEEAAEDAAKRVNLAIETRIRRDTVLKKQWEADWALQQKIDQRLQSGEPIPESWIKNPFHKLYYAHKGILIPDQ